jgi:glycosyltransferase involved in cell wall biosynthesis
MRVAIEAASLTLSSGGLARYTSELSLALARNYPDDEFWLTSDQAFAMPAPVLRKGAPPDDPPANLRRGGGPRNTLERRWWLWGLTRELGRLGADLIHGPDFSVPYVPSRPSVLTLHDLSPWMNSEWHGDAARVRRRTPILLEMGVATMVIAPSEAVRKQAMERFRLRPDRVVAIREAAAPWFAPASVPYALGGVPNRRYFLFVGTIEPRKNLATLLEAWREVRNQADLVLVGRRRADAPPIVEEPGLHVLGEVADEQLPSLYSGALAFVYPSLYEGFGLPVVEAMQCGAPVIASRAVEEVAGDAAIYADSAEELTRAMRELAGNPQRLPEWRERSLARAGEFTWDRAARETYAVYEEARKRFGR